MDIRIARSADLRLAPQPGGAGDRSGGPGGGTGGPAASGQAGRLADAAGRNSFRHGAKRSTDIRIECSKFVARRRAPESRAEPASEITNVSYRMDSAIALDRRALQQNAGISHLFWLAKVVRPRRPPPGPAAPCRPAVVTDRHWLH